MSHPFSPHLLKNKRLGFIGAGHMGQAMIRALIESKTMTPEQIHVSDSMEGRTKKVQELYGVKTYATNEPVIENSDIIVIAVKPQDLASAIEPMASAFQQEHVVISLAAGFTISSLRKLLPQVSGLVRVMPNTPATIRRAVIGYCFADKSEIYQSLIEALLEPLGIVVQADEGDPFEALTVSAASGTGFVFEIMQYWQEWIEEHGFDPQTARKMVVQTFWGAAELAASTPDLSLVELQDRVVSKKGVTAAGLDSMRELEIERALRYSFEKAVLRDQELSRGTAKQ